MNAAAAALLGCVFGVAVTGAVAFAALRDGANEAPVPVGGGGERAADAPPGAPAPAVAPDQSLVLARLDALAAQVERLQQAVAELPAGGGTRVPVATTANAIVDADSLQAAMDEIERRRVDALSDDELRNEARVAAKTGRLGEAIAACERLVVRAQTPEQRAEALTELAIMQRSDKARVADAQRTLQGIVDEFGVGSEAGREAIGQLMWTVPAGDEQRGVDHARTYLAYPDLTAEQRVWGRWALGINLHGAGDTAAARAELQQLQRDIDGQPQHEKLSGFIRERLASWQ